MFVSNFLFFFFKFLFIIVKIILKKYLKDAFQACMKKFSNIFTADIYIYVKLYLFIVFCFYIQFKNSI